MAICDNLYRIYQYEGERRGEEGKGEDLQDAHVGLVVRGELVLVERLALHKANESTRRMMDNI